MTPPGVVGAGVPPVVLVVVVLAVAVAAALAGAGLARRRAAADVAARAVEAGVELPDGTTTTAGRAAVALGRALIDARHDGEAARATSTMLQDALDGLPHGVVLIDSRGGVVHRNAAARALRTTARRSDALVEAAIAELVAAALEGIPDRRELELFGPPRRVMLVDVTPILTSGGRAALGLIEDVTDRRHLEAVRRDFVANISHELKTPVGAIGLLAETLVGEDDPEVVERLAGRIQDESWRVGRTIEDLLELSQIERPASYDSDHVVVADAVEEAVSRLRPAAEHAGITLDTSAVDPEVAVGADRRQLTSAISNLVDNAVKYSDTGAVVEVSAVRQGDGQVAIGVTDHGIGIPARDLERVFERFYRVDQGRARSTGGTGLGLAIVRHVAVNHHGSVAADSRLGEGSTFTLCLPAAPGPGARPADLAGRIVTDPADLRSPRPPQELLR